MKIYEGESYSNGQKGSNKIEVMVTGLSEDRVQYSEILGWDAGWASVSGVRKSMTRSRFKEAYPVAIEYVESN